MNRPNRSQVILTSVLAFALMSPAVMAQDPKINKERKQVIVRDGQVFLSEDGKPFLLNRGSLLSKTYIGVNLVTLSPELRSHFGGGENGTLISTVAAESPAARSGLRVGDVITSVNGEKVASPGDVTRAIRDKKAGDSVRIDFVRGGVPQHLFITVAEREVAGFDIDKIVTPEMLKAGAIALESADRIGEYFKGPEWKARVEQFQDCARVQGRVRELETRLKELEKRLEK